MKQVQRFRVQRLKGYNSLKSHTILFESQDT